MRNGEVKARTPAGVRTQVGHGAIALERGCRSIGNMGPFDPIVSLPPIGAGVERATLDLKAKLEHGKTACMAIDVAAFANHLGGSLIIGAAEKAGSIGAYVPVPQKEINRCKDAMSKAVAQRCRPAPRVDFVPMPYGDGFVLVVNVWPQPSGMVGVRIDGNKDDGGYGGDAWAFPIRSGSDAFYVSAENLPMYLDSRVRRIVLLLNQIPIGEVVRCTVIENAHAGHYWFEGFDEALNVIRLKDCKEPNEPHWIALDAPLRVFQTEGSVWCLVFGNRFDLLHVPA